MNVVALIIAILAAAVFFVEAWRSNSVVSFGLGLLTTAWIVELVWTTATKVTLG